MRRTPPLAALLALAAGPLAAQGLAYEGSLAASTGDYFFTERTNSMVLTNGLAIRAGLFTFRGSLPLWWRNTTLVTPTGAGGVPDGGPTGRDAVRDSGQARKQRGGSDGSGGGGVGGAGTEAGAGAVLSAGGVQLSSDDPDVPAPAQSLTGWDLAVADPSLQVGMRLPTGSRVLANLSASAKLPLTGTSTIGTGEWDFGASASVSVLFASRFTAGLDGSYWHLGDMPDFDFNDPVTGSASLGALFSGGWAALASFTAGTSAIEGYDPPIWLGAAVSRLTGRGSYGLNLSIGFTETVPDFGAGLIWSIPIRGPQ